ncbi:glycosyltransferase [Christiangramia sp. ASW11-125]|uniref:glycosyltransferase n=1 Tax=Christiangramia sp. ASW11-125 TaxID=3400701 RepID=UPI003AAAB8C3
MGDICVSIFLLTFNQEEFIGQTIESILGQQTDFKYQLVIGEDCSSDNTRQICEKYARENPNKIKLLPSEVNHGLIKNFIRTYKQCNGKYVAICDGDDYWNDPFKLQKQVDFLEANPDFGIVFTSFKLLFPDGRMFEKDYSKQAEITNFEELILGNYICSATAVFRNKKNINDFPGWLDTCPYGDWPLYLWTTKKGAKIKYLDEVTAVYRREIGVSERMKIRPISILKANCNIVAQAYRDSNFSNKKVVIKNSLLNHEFALLASYLRAGKKRKALKYIAKLGVKKPGRLIRILLYMGKLKIAK